MSIMANLRSYLANGRFQVRAINRVPEAFIPLAPLDQWPKHPIAIRLKNLGNSIIQYMYLEDGVQKDGVLMGNTISEQPTMFYANKTYLFRLKSGKYIESTR